MYCLKLKLDGCNEFEYVQHLIPNDRNEITIYYDTRENAINELIIFYKEIVNSIHSSYYSNKRMLNLIKNRLKDIESTIIKYDTFSIKFLLGFPTFEITLTKLTPEVLNSGFIFKESHMNCEINYKL